MAFYKITNSDKNKSKESKVVYNLVYVLYRYIYRKPETCSYKIQLLSYD